MCDDLDPTMSELSARGVRCTDITDARWGRLSRFRLPGSQGARTGSACATSTRPRDCLSTACGSLGLFPALAMEGTRWPIAGPSVCLLGHG